MVNSFILQISLFLFAQFSLGFDLESKQNVALYWGQNSGGSQVSLGSYCEATDADIYLLSFLYQFPTIGLDFASACTSSYSDGTLHCSEIAQDIEKCQSLGKKVLLSMGGATGSYGFSDDSSAKEFAQTLWDTFGAGSGTAERPFDSAIVDGFDFDIENSNSVGYAALVTELRTLFATSTKQFYISAAPQCPYPDASVGDLLENADVDFAFIQFYNNYCNVDKSFNWDTWQDYAESVSPNKNIKLYLGLPGSASAAGSGYISDLTVLQETISKVSESGNFGGVAMWDASQAVSNEIDGLSYLSHIKSLLGDSSSGSTTTTLSPSSSATSSSSTSSTSTSAPSSTETTSSLATTSDTPVTTTSLTTPSSTSVPITSAAEIETSTTPTTTSAPETTTSQEDVKTTKVSNDHLTTTLTPSSTVERTTLQPSPQPTATASAAHSQAVALNALYSAGKYNGEETCTSGDIACSANGEFAICNFGSWVNMACASGTTCFASESSDTLTIGCNFISQKENFIN